jgi:hypothetical protein
MRTVAEALANRLGIVPLRLAGVLVVAAAATPYLASKCVTGGRLNVSGF